MSIKSKNKRVGIGLIVAATCIVVAGFWAVLATPETALAAKPDKPGKPGGGETTIFFKVLLGVEEDGNHFNVLLGMDETGNLVFGDPDIFMACDSGIEGRIESIGGGTNIDRMIVNRPSPIMDITSVIGLLEDQSCFADLLVGGRFVSEKGTLLIELPDRTGNEMTVDYGFRAKNTKGKDVYYTIHTTGMLVVVESGFGHKADWEAVQDAVNDGTANLEKIPDFFLQVKGGILWTLSKSGSQKFACTGNGTFESGFGIRITDPRLDMQNNTLCP